MQVSLLTKSALAGIILSLLTIIFVLLLPKSMALDFLALLLALIVGIYLGFAIAEEKVSSALAEIPVAGLFFVIAGLGLQVSPLFLVLGYAAHGFWDLLHHPKAIKTKVVSWYPPFCAIYDWLVAGFILVYTQFNIALGLSVFVNAIAV